MAQIRGTVQVMELRTDSALDASTINCIRVLFPVQHSGSLCRCYSSGTLKCLTSSAILSVGEQSSNMYRAFIKLQAFPYRMVIL